MNNENESRKEWREAFRVVIDQYVENRSTNGSTPCMDYRNLGRIRSGTGVKVQRPSVTDFLCDVELTAQRVLTPREHVWFSSAYKKLNGDKHVPAPILQSISEKLGKAFMARQMYPVTLYFGAEELKG